VYSSDEIIESIEVNISDSFCHFTKAKGTSGNGEAKLFIKGFQRLHEIKTFFSNFRYDNEYVYLRENLINYLNDASYEYLNQSIIMNDISGYENNILEKYKPFLNYVRSCDNKIQITKKNFEIKTQKQGHYLRPKDLPARCDCGSKGITSHPWNLMRDIALPKISKVQIIKVRHFGSSNYTFYFLLFLDHDVQKVSYHNSQILIDKILSEIKLKYVGLKRQRMIEARAGQGYFRDQIFKRTNICLVTGIKNAKLLEAAHIKPWSRSEDIEKIDGYNGILLTSNCHKLFDIGFITFDDNGKLLKSNILKENEYNKLFKEDNNVNRDPISNEKSKTYLEWHRKWVFEKFNNYEF